MGLLYTPLTLLLLDGECALGGFDCERLNRLTELLADCLIHVFPTE
jgi:hypothetical protein